MTPTDSQAVTDAPKRFSRKVCSTLFSTIPPDNSSNSNCPNIKNPEYVLEGFHKHNKYPEVIEVEGSEWLLIERKRDPAQPDPFEGMSAAFKPEFGPLLKLSADPLAEFRKYVQGAGDQYLKSYPGASDTPSNMELHTMLQQLPEPIPATYKQLHDILICIEYRMDLQEKANQYADHLRIGGTIPRCQDIDIEDWLRVNMSWIYKENHDKIQRMSHARWEIVMKRIFGKPDWMLGQGIAYYKPVMWLATAMAVKGWDEGKIKDGVKELQELVGSREIL
ncbi:uncharacterized protein RAG0_12039 [Rhynchosporium agropyri]|uniref:Uncharacterized protein n=1 Tax=Rhynchosporium agropyri TaxID=914238 RepID=A0A1E1L6T7_9HELO|nr:uncharacterized protein RAG0_12039 [Rhynchosporium agropyri]